MSTDQVDVSFKGRFYAVLWQVLTILKSSVSLAKSAPSTACEMVTMSDTGKSYSSSTKLIPNIQQTTLLQQGPSTSPSYRYHLWEKDIQGAFQNRSRERQGCSVCTHPLSSTRSLTIIQSTSAVVILSRTSSRSLSRA